LDILPATAIAGDHRAQALNAREFLGATGECRDRIFAADPFVEDEPPGPAC
jgi:hypothetical protein